MVKTKCQQLHAYKKEKNVDFFDESTVYKIMMSTAFYSRHVCRITFIFCTEVFYCSDAWLRLNVNNFVTRQSNFFPQNSILLSGEEHLS